MISIPLVMAAPPPYWVNGTVKRIDTDAVLAGAIVVNNSNATQSDTTGADGFFNISGFYNATNVTLKINASGFTQAYVIGINVNGADNQTYGTTSNVTLSLVTPSNSVATSASVTKNGAVISWTVTATDNWNNNNVANRVIYYASGEPNTTSSWSNTTTSPSFTLSNLRSNNAYTVVLQTYNGVNNAARDLDNTVTFTTLKAGTKSYWTPPAPVSTKKSAIDKILPSMSRTKKIVLGAAVVIVVVIAYFGFVQGGKGGSGRKR
jgi:hypothetical protein